MMRQKPDHIILYVGKNDLSCKGTPGFVASPKSITNLAVNLKNCLYDLSIYNIIEFNY